MQGIKSFHHHENLSLQLITFLPYGLAHSCNTRTVGPKNISYNRGAFQDNVNFL